MILQNEIKCNKCGDQIHSAHRHDFKWCKCGAVAVDGGQAYIRHLGTDYTDMTIVISDELYMALKKGLIWARENKRNELGAICAMARELREAGLDIRNLEKG